MTAPINTNGQYDNLCPCGMRGLHACGLWASRPIQPMMPPTYTSGFFSTTDPRVAKLEARVAELEAIIARLPKRRPKPSKDAG